MCRRSFSGVIAVALIAFAGLGLACSDSTTSPLPLPSTTPQAPPPAPPPVGFAAASVVPSSGPSIGGDDLRVSGRGFVSGVRVTLDGVALPVTRVTDTLIDVRTQAHVLGTVDLVVMNPDGQTGVLSYTFAEFFVTGGPNLVVPGAELTVSWVAPEGRGCRGGGDWIALYKIGDPDDTGAANGHSDIWFDHVCGQVAGTWKLKAPAEPGDYEFRFMAGSGSVARSAPIVIRP